MHRAAVATLLAFLGAVSTAAADGAAPESLRLVDVPYVSQSELLCGGAAAAMLMRHAGARGVHAEDFSSLVDRRRHGIAAADLRRALAERGFDVHTASGSPAAVRERLAAGQPVMALIEDRPGRNHYVVIVGWQDGAVVYHDPARAPFMATTEANFVRAWSSSDRWMLVARTTTGALASRPAPPAEVLPATGGEHHDVLHAFQREDYDEAIRLVEAAIEARPEDEAAWRLLAASRYLRGDPGVALDAWNRADEPRIDLVRIDGLARTPHRTVERLMGLPPGHLLTREALVRAKRRLGLLPSQQASNVSYTALPGGVAEIRGAVVERSPLPSRDQWLIEAARGAVSREVQAPFTNIAHAGDRLGVSWRFRDGQPRIGFAFLVPGPEARGVWSLTGGWQEERHAAGETFTWERRELQVEWTDWVAARVRFSAGAGLARWTGHGNAAIVSGGIELRPIADSMATSARASVAGGEISFATISADTRWRVPLPGSLRAVGSASIGHASSAAPRDTWFGAGTGHGRPLLLRAHPLLEDGAIAGPAFGRAIAQATIELQRDVFRRNLWTVGVAGFADAARTWHRPDGSRSPLHVDLGLGVRLRLAPGAPAVRIDVARGLRDGEVVVSAGVVVQH
jgi:hypothetical protein